MPSATEIKALLAQCTAEERLEIFRHLRGEIAIHPLEQRLNAKAEVILEAFSRASDLTLRGIRGIIAEASFSVDVVGRLSRWTDVTPSGDNAFDSMLQDSFGVVRVQVKMQRQRAHRPMLANEAYRYLPENLYVVETQRTRGGRNAEGGQTRPYRFGEFDILAVSLHPSTNIWSDFVYTVERWLIPDPRNPDCLLKFQPVSAEENDEWSRDFNTAVEWFRSALRKRICADVVIPEPRGN